jgi:hypothetical protein
MLHLYKYSNIAREFLFTFSLKISTLLLFFLALALVIFSVSGGSTFFPPLTLSRSGAVLRTRIARRAHFDPFGVKIERSYFLTFPKYIHRPY